jgi:hypothetical protein
LTSSSPAELAVDARRSMPLAADDMQATQRSNSIRQRDMRTTASHVGRDGNGAAFPCPCNHLRLFGILACIQQAEGDTVSTQARSTLFALFDRRCTDQHRATRSRELRCQLGDG